MRKTAIVLAMIVVILCIYVWAQNGEKLNTVVPMTQLLEISKGMLSHGTSLICDLLREIAKRTVEVISAISLDVARILIEVASDLDARFRSVLHRPII